VYEKVEGRIDDSVSEHERDFHIMVFLLKISIRDRHCQRRSAAVSGHFRSRDEGEFVEPRQSFPSIFCLEIHHSGLHCLCQTWLYAIANAIESCINGTSSIRTFDTTKLRTASGALDDHAIPTRLQLYPQSPLSLPKPGLIGVGLPGAGSGHPSDRRSMPPPMMPHRRNSNNASASASAAAPDGVRARKASFRKAWKQGTELAGETWSNVKNIGGGGGVGHGGNANSNRNSFVYDSTAAGTLQADNSGSAPQQSVENSALHRPGTSPLLPTTSPNSSYDLGQRGNMASWSGEESLSADSEIEKRVLEMVGLDGLGLGRIDVPNVQGQSQGLVNGRNGRDITPPETPVFRSNEGSMSTLGAEQVVDEVWDMKRLREIAERADNTKCADCGKSMRSSRWATISEY
jgi:hypothetical protein